AGDHCRFPGVKLGNDKTGNFPAASGDSNGQGAAHAADSTIQGQLTDEDIIRNFFPGQAAISAENAEGHWKIETGAFFFYVGGSKIDDDVGGRDIVSAVLEGGANALVTLTHGGIRETDCHKLIFKCLNAGNVNLDLHHVGINS